MDIEEILRHGIEMKNDYISEILYLQNEIDNISDSFELKPSPKGISYDNEKVDISLSKTDLLQQLEKIDKTKKELLESYFDQIHELSVNIFIINSVEERIRFLPQIQKKIIKLFYQENKLAEEVIYILNIGRSSFFREKNELIRVLKNELYKAKEERLCKNE